MGARIFGAPSLEGPCHWGNNRNADLFWDIDVNPISVRLELEGFGMSVKDDRADVLPGCVRNGDCAVAIAYPDVSGLLIVSDVVGIPTKAEGFLHSQRFTIIDPKLTVSSRGDVEPAGFKIVVNPLRFFEALDFRSALPSPYIEDFDGAIFKSSDNKR
jgi:hypothetical protein